MYLPRTLGASFAGDQAKGRRAAFDSFDFGFIGRGVDPYLEDGEGAKRSGGPESSVWRVFLKEAPGVRALGEGRAVVWVRALVEGARGWAVTLRAKF